MAVVSIIQKSQLEGGQRLDAEYYQPEYLEVAQKLDGSPTIADVAVDVRYGLYVEPDYLEEGVDFIRAMNTTNFWIDGEVLKISRKKVPEEYLLRTGDCLIVRSGANTGLVSVIYPNFAKATFGSYTIRLRFDKVNPFFAAVFLNTKYGFAQTQRSQTGAAQPNLNIPNINEIRIPQLSEQVQKETESRCLSVYKTKQLSETLYSRAEKLLLEEIGLANFEEEAGLWSIVRLSEAQAAGRIDAEYFQPKYEKLESRIREYGAKYLEEVINNVSVKFDPALEPNKIFKYVELSNINASIGTIDGYSETSGSEAPSRAKRVLKANDVIVSSIEGSLGKVALVDKLQAGHLASTGFFQFRSKSILPEVLQVLFKSIVLRYQFEQRCAGTILTAVPKESIKNILVPILPEKTQQKIAELVRQSHEARAKAKQLLEEAKRKVEESIESVSTAR